jgi:hypothetical protein
MTKENEIQYFETLLSAVTDSKVELVAIKPKREYKPRKPSARYNEEKGEYNHKPLDPNYFNEYYKKCNSKIECPRCGRFTPKLQLSRHVKSMRCQKETSLKMDLCTLD